MGVFNGCSLIQLKSDSHLPKKKNFIIWFNDSSARSMKNAFYSILKALFVLKILKFLSWHFCHVEKTAWVERRHSMTPLEYEATAWLSKNYNTHIARYLTNRIKPANEIWSVNRISQEKCFSSKIMQKMRQEN